MNYLALDLSKSRTGFAIYFDGDVEELFDAPGWQTLAKWRISKRSNSWAAYDLPTGGIASIMYGSWVLGTEYTTRGGVFDALQRHLADLHAIVPFEQVYVEEPITPGQLQGGTTVNTIRLAIGLASAAETFCHVFKQRTEFPDGVRGYHEINISAWRADFIGKIENQAAKAKAKHAGKSATDQLKRLVMERARQLGLPVRYNDESDAIGILTYGILLSGKTPPWIAEETLRPILTGSIA